MDLGNWVRRSFICLSLVGLTAAIAFFQPHISLISSQSSPLLPFPQRITLAPERAIAQTVDRQVIANRVYQQLPDLPLENHYIHIETGEVDSDNTLVSRLIQYHYNIQRRPLTSRFDWKLTLADYLGANEWITAEIYPDSRLESNPYADDLTIIQALDRAQREALIQALLTAILAR